jgi:hypothetical protein
MTRIYFAALRVRAALFADKDLSAAERLRAAVRVCRDKASGEAAAPLSRRRALSVAWDRLAEGFLPESAFSRSRSALCRVASEVLPGFGGANFTPARRALESPMAMACFVDRAPCFPARISSISSRTNSPAWVEADFPSRSSRRARSMVCFCGMIDSEYSPPRSRLGVGNVRRSEVSRGGHGGHGGLGHRLWKMIFRSLFVGVIRHRTVPLSPKKTSVSSVRDFRTPNAKR